MVETFLSFNICCLQAELDRVKGESEKEYLGMAESMPGGLNIGNVETLSSGSSSLDKRKNVDLNSMDAYSDEHGIAYFL